MSTELEPLTDLEVADPGAAAEVEDAIDGVMNEVADLDFDLTDEELGLGPAALETPPEALSVPAGGPVEHRFVAAGKVKRWTKARPGSNGTRRNWTVAELPTEDVDAIAKILEAYDTPGHLFEGRSRTETRTVLLQRPFTGVVQ